MEHFYQVIEKATPIQKFLNNFVKVIDKDLRVKINLMFECDIHTGIIYFGVSNFVEDLEESVEQVANDLFASGFDYRQLCLPQAFSFFHEIGHIIMSQFYKDKTFQHRKYSIQREMIENTYYDNELNESERNQIYNVIPMENDANSWAMLFIKENRKLVSYYESRILPLMSDLFKPSV